MVNGNDIWCFMILNAPTWYPRTRTAVGMFHPGLPIVQDPVSILKVNLWVLRALMTESIPLCVGGSYWCLAGNGWELGNLIIIHNYYGSFPHSLLGTSKRFIS